MSRCALVGSLVLAGVLLLGSVRHARAEKKPEPHAAVMARAAQGWLALLTPEQRKQAALRFDHPQRRRWQATPGRRVGLAWRSQTAVQRTAAEALLRTGLSAGGMRRFRGVVRLEGILRLQEAARVRLNRSWRDPGLYWIAVFGAPAARGTWSWRIEGHHYSRHFTCVGGRISVTPAFHGANPARVASGPQRGLRVLADEEDYARGLWTALDAQRRKRAFLPTAPRDFVPYAPRDLTLMRRAGLPGSAMTAGQRQKLGNILRVWSSTLHPALAPNAFDLARLDDVHFAWMGSAQPGRPFAYRIHGRTFLLELWHGRNHIHSVWRDLRNEYGAADLARVRAAAQKRKAR